MLQGISILNLHINYLIFTEEGGSQPSQPATPPLPGTNITTLHVTMTAKLLSTSTGESVLGSVLLQEGKADSEHKYT